MWSASLRILLGITSGKEGLITKSKIYLFIFTLLVFPVPVFSQTLEEKLVEVDAYAKKVYADWNVPGMGDCDR